MSPVLASSVLHLGAGGTLGRMPTTRPRHQITETDEVAAALDAAARRWPDVTHRSELLRRLVAEGHRAVVAHQDREVEARRAAVHRTAGALTGVYEPDELAELRRDWPA